MRFVKQNPKIKTIEKTDNVHREIKSYSFIRSDCDYQSTDFTTNITQVAHQINKQS